MVIMHRLSAHTLGLICRKLYSRMDRAGVYSLVGLLVVVAGIETASGQEFRRLGDMKTEGTSYHIFAKEGEATIELILLGEVGAPGIYVVNTDVELDELIALSGGYPLISSSDADVTVTIRLFRGEGEGREMLYEASSVDMLSQPGLFPALQEGDVVTVERYTHRRRRINILQLISVATSVTSLILLISRGRR